MHGRRMCVDAVSSLDQSLLDLKMIGVKKVTGGTMRDSFLVDGVAFKKTFSYAGFEQQPKHFQNPKVCVLCAPHRSHCFQCCPLLPLAHKASQMKTTPHVVATGRRGAR
jgi:hypothetical protein